MPVVVAKMIERAIDGDMVAAQALTKLAIPAVRPVEEPVALDLPRSQSLTAQGQAVLDAVGAGELGPMQGQALLTSLAALGQLRANDDFERRLAALEERQHEGAAD